MLDLQGLEDFLIQKSKINKDFIKDFFGFQKTNEYYKYVPFTISLDDVAFWLETAKDKLKKTLVNSYLKLVDYIYNQTLFLIILFMIKNMFINFIYY